MVNRPDAPVLAPGKLAWGYYIRKTRKERGLVIADLTRLLGARHSNISQWETGIFAPSQKYIPRIIEFLGFVPWPCSPYQSTLSEAVRAAREIQGWRQVDLGAQAGISDRTVSLLERGQSISLQSITRLERALNTTFQRYLVALLLVVHPLIRSLSVNPIGHTLLRQPGL